MSPAASSATTPVSTRYSPCSLDRGFPVKNPLCREQGLIPDDLENALQAGIPVGKQIDVLGLPLNARGDAAIVETDRNQKDIVQREAAGAIQRIPDFRLKSAPFPG